MWRAPMPASLRSAPRVEHVFAHQTNRFGRFIRTIGLARAEAKLTLANIAYNFGRLIFHERTGPWGESAQNRRKTPKAAQNNGPQAA